MLKKHIFSASGTGGREFESRHFDQKRTDSPCGYLFFFSSWRFDSNSSCEARCEFAYPAQRSKSSLFRRRARIYSPKAKIPPLPCRFFRSEVLRRLASIVVERRSHPCSSNSLFCSGASRKTVINCFSLAYPPLRPKKQEHPMWVLLLFLVCGEDDNSSFALCAKSSSLISHREHRASS